MKANAKPKPKKRGRPTRDRATAKALSGVDLTAIDPRAVLLAIAADTSSPATARVSACRALLGQVEAPKKPDKADAVTELALKLLRGAK